MGAGAGCRTQPTIEAGGMSRFFTATGRRKWRGRCSPLSVVATTRRKEKKEEEEEEMMMIKKKKKKKKEEKKKEKKEGEAKINNGLKATSSWATLTSCDWFIERWKVTQNRSEFKVGLCRLFSLDLQLGRKPSRIDAVDSSMAVDWSSFLGRCFVPWNCLCCGSHRQPFWGDSWASLWILGGKTPRIRIESGRIRAENLSWTSPTSSTLTWPLTQKRLTFWQAAERV